MTHAEFSTIARQQLERKLNESPPDNDSRDLGYALVNVLHADDFADAHIPQSINIPVSELDQFEQRFSKDKDIIVYCASLDCDASPQAAQALAQRGFYHVYDYEAGTAGWKQAGNELAHGRV